MEYTRNSDLVSMGIDEFAYLNEVENDEKPKKARKSKGD